MQFKLVFAFAILALSINKDFHLVKGDHVIGKKYRRIYDSVTRFTHLLYDRMAMNRFATYGSIVIPSLGNNVLLVALCLGLNNEYLLDDCEDVLQFKWAENAKDLASLYRDFLKAYVHSGYYDRNSEFQTNTGKYIMMRTKIFLNLNRKSLTKNKNEYLNLLEDYFQFEVFKQTDERILANNRLPMNETVDTFDLYHQEYHEFTPEQKLHRHNKKISPYGMLEIEFGFVLNWFYPFSINNTAEFPFYYMDGTSGQLKYLMKDILFSSNDYPYKIDCELEAQLLEIPLKGGFKLMLMVPIELDGVEHVEKVLRMRQFVSKIEFPFLEAFKGLDKDYKNIELRILKLEEVKVNYNWFEVMIKYVFPLLYRKTRISIPEMEENFYFTHNNSVKGRKAYIRKYFRESKESDNFIPSIKRVFDACLPHVFVILDHPFLFSIVHASSGIPIYYGRLSTPFTRYKFSLTRNNPDLHNREKVFFAYKRKPMLKNSVSYKNKMKMYLKMSKFRKLDFDPVFW